MNQFVNSISEQMTTTSNGMLARETTANANVDLFFKIGASRGKDIIPQFVAAFVENKEYALRTAQWVRDVREGAGERKIFRDILLHLEKTDKESLIKILPKIPELGRWDDLLIFTTQDVKELAFNMIKNALVNQDGLCAKWLPREKSAKRDIAVELREYLGWTPKQYRKNLADLTSVVETAMCSKEWDKINFSHVPSVASARYKKAFFKNAKEKYEDYVAKLTKGDTTVKVNASAIYPHDVIKNVNSMSGAELGLVDAQWKALPNYMGAKKVLPVIDVSESMECKVGGNPSLSCKDVAIALGLYCADKSESAFKDVFISFSMEPKIHKVSGAITQKIMQTLQTKGYNTDLHKVFNQLLSFAKTNNVTQEDMPDYILLLSDMQFDQGCSNTAQGMIEQKYLESGYTLPKIIYWNLRAYDNVPVKYNKDGVALISGFSPSIMKAVLSDKLEVFSPMGVMLETIMNPKYDI